MFDVHGTDRLTKWKEFRDSLEQSETPFQDVAEFWSHAPFVSSYLDYQNPSEWPDPWHLILDNRLDDLAITLGMLYTIKLTHRFMETEFEIHKTESNGKKDLRFFLIVDNKYVLNMAYKQVLDVSEVKNYKTSKIWSGKKIL